jgi:hypothetical protein
LKTLLKEARRIAEVKKVQMIKKEEDCEKLEQEVVSLRKSLRNSQVQTSYLQESKKLQSV